MVSAEMIRINRLRPRTKVKMLSPFLINGSPKLCWGCGQPFPVRQGHIEALVAFACLFLGAAWIAQSWEREKMYG